MKHRRVRVFDLKNAPTLPAEALMFTTDQAPGAIANGSLVYKCNSDSTDAHVDGAPAHVLGSWGPVPNGPFAGTYGYFIEWLDKPGVPCFIQSTRIRQ